MSQLKTILLFGVLSALFIGVGGAFAPQHLAVFVGIAAVLNLGAYFFSDRIVLARALLKLHGAAHVVAPEHPHPGTASLFIVNPFEGLQRVSRWFSTHPSVEERVARLRALPVARRHAYGH